MTVVYRLLDADGHALYIGHTVDLPRRMCDHAGTEYMRLTASIEWSAPMVHADALAFERAEIGRLRPKFNVLGNPTRKLADAERRRAFKQAYIAAGSPRDIGRFFQVYNGLVSA